MATLRELFSLEGRRALITGSSQGIGFALAAGLRAAGAEIVLNGRDDDKLARAAAALRAEDGPAVHLLPFGATRHDAARAAIDGFEAELVALWTRFPNVQDVRLLREVESDRPDTRFELVIQMRFASRAAIAEALASDARAQSRAASQRLFDLFEGDVFHTVFRTDVLTVPPA